MRGVIFGKLRIHASQGDKRDGKALGQVRGWLVNHCDQIRIAMDFMAQKITLKEGGSI